MPVIISTDGTTGPRGNSVLNGVGAPSADLGFDGDWYLDRSVPTNLVMYGPKTAGAWGAGNAFGTPPPWLPSDSNLAWGSYAPILAGQAIVPPTSNAGHLTLQRVLLRQDATLTRIWYGVSSSDSGAMTNCYLGLYDHLGVLQAQTTDISAHLKVAGVYGDSFTAPYVAVAGEYFIALLLNGTWSTFNLKESHGGITTNAGLTAPHLTISNLGSNLTTLPDTIDLATQATNLVVDGWGSQWYGLN